MSAHTALLDGLGKAFNALATQFHPNVTISLVTASEPYSEYDVVLEIANKRFFEYSNFRRNVSLQVAASTTALTDAMAVATHIKIDEDFYRIDDSSRTPPQSTDVTWDILGDLHEKRSTYGAL